MIGNAVRISAKTGAGIQELLLAVEKNLPVKTVRVRLLLPFSKAGLAAEIRRDGVVFSEEYTADGLLLDVQVGPELLAKTQEFSLETGKSD